MQSGTVSRYVSLCSTSIISSGSITVAGMPVVIKFSLQRLSAARDCYIALNSTQSKGETPAVNHEPW